LRAKEEFIQNSFNEMTDSNENGNKTI